MGQPFGPLQPKAQEEPNKLTDDEERAAHEAALEAERAAHEAALEAGRLLFAAPWVFDKSCHAIDQLPPGGTAEVAFAGRSNVGKSSLLNALVGQKGLAKASNTPGRTRSLNIFRHEAGLPPVIVDMPGYGYAKAPKVEVAAWTALVFDYLRGRAGLQRIYLLIDARHGVKPVDNAAMDVMDEAAVSYQAVLTKTDKAGRGGTDAALLSTQEALRRRPAAHPEVLTTSAEKGDGLPELRAAIAALSG